MKRLLGALVLLLVLPATVPARSKPGCDVPHTRTIAADRHIRVFETHHKLQAAYRTYGCLRSRGKPYRFYEADFPTAFEPIRLAGPFVAYGDYNDCAAGFCDPNFIIVQDLRNGTTHMVDASISVAQIFGLVLRRNGSAAFVIDTFDTDGVARPGVEVVKTEYGREPVVLDSGPQVDKGSLALAGSTLYWTRLGLPMSAPLN